MTLAREEPAPTLRITLLTGVLAVLFLALFSRLWFLQVLAGDRYLELAESNRVGFVVIEPPRGRILAVGGEELVKNRPAPTVSGDRDALLNGIGQPRDERAEQVIQDLAAVLQMTPDDIIDQLLSRKYSPFRPVPIKEDVPPDVFLFIDEHREFFPGVITETLPVRTYPGGTLGAHLVGYLGEISEEELETDERYAEYRPGELIGRYGLEATYEPALQGDEGLRTLEVNARGVVQRVMAEDPPTPGADLITSIDFHLQRETERVLEEGILASRSIRRQDGRLLPSVAGAAVVLDPRDGSVRAMASWPTFDPADFVGGISTADWSVLQDPANQYPMINRAIQSAYPPGSVFKVVSGAAYMNAGLVAPHSRVNCPPAWRLGGITFRNWNTRSEGALDLAGALMRSCDTYFYELAYQQWNRENAQERNGGTVDEVLPRVAEAFGLGRTLGIDLPSERAGTIPGRAWRASFWEANRDTYCAKAQQLTPGSYAQKINEDLCLYGGNWRGGDAVNSSIGQGDVLTTPLQIASAYGAIGNGGTLWQPQLGERIVAPDGAVIDEIEPVALGQLPLAPDQLRGIQQGLESVVMNPRGTARRAFDGFPTDAIPVAGKTGTAEMKPKVPYAWFAAYAPVHAPEYVVAVAVEEGGGGSQTAAPIARRILEAAFRLEVTPFAAGPGDVD